MKQVIHCLLLAESLALKLISIIQNGHIHHCCNTTQKRTPCTDTYPGCHTPSYGSVSSGGSGDACYSRLHCDNGSRLCCQGNHTPSITSPQ